MKTLFFIFLSIILFCAVPVTADVSSSQPVHLNLKSVLKISSQQSPSTVISRESVQQIIAQINDKKSILYPQITADISERRRTSDLRSSGITFAAANDPLIGPYNAFDARVKVTQKIFDPELKNRLDWLRLGKSVTELQSQKIEQDILALAAVQYVQVVRARQTSELVRSMLSRDFRSLKILRKQFELGTASDLEWNASRAQYLRTLQQGRNARREFMKSRLNLMATLGLSPETRVVIEEWSEPEFQNQFHSETKTVSADIRLAEAKLKMSQQLVASGRAEYWPKLALSADYGASGEGASSKNSSETYAMGVEASIPIFDAGGRRNRIKTAEAEQKINEISLDDVKRRNSIDQTTNRQMIVDAGAAIRQAESQYRLACEHFDIVRRKVEMGTGHELDLFSARSEMMGALDQKFEAEALYLMSMVNLAHSMGSLRDWENEWKK